jgi:hypothetical protein
MATRNRTLRQLPESEQQMLRVLAEVYAELGAEVTGYGRTELSKKFGVSPVVVDALKAWHTMNNR